jgi:hypothetical protein
MLTKQITLFLKGWMHPNFRHFRHSRQFWHLSSLIMENAEKQYEQLAHLVVAGATE